MAHLSGPGGDILARSLVVRFDLDDLANFHCANRFLGFQKRAGAGGSASINYFVGCECFKCFGHMNS